MATRLNPYLSFRGNARDALEFYRSVFGGELTLSTFGESHASDVPEEQDQIMHGALVTPDGLCLMGSDSPSQMELRPNGTVALTGDDDARLREWWQKLSDGGQVQVPLETAPWGDAFGMCADRFGVAWMLNIAGSGQPEG